MEQEMKIFHDNFEDGPSSGLLFGELSLYLGEEEEELEIVWDLGYKYDGVVYPLEEVKNFIKNYEQRAGQSYYNFFSPVTIELDGDLVIFTYEMPPEIRSKYRTRSVEFLLEDLKEFIEKHENLKKVAKVAKVAKVKNRFIPDLTIKPEDFGIDNYEFDSNGFLNVKGDVNFNNKNLTKLPFTFGKVEGDFRCANNNLTSLKGAPKEVGGDFRCYNNSLTSLKGAPQEVGGVFYCYNNILTSLQGAPEKVEESFDCSDNNLTSLRGAPEKVGGYFNCSDNNLTSLQGAPKEVREFNCKNNKTKFTKEDVEKVCKVGDQITI